MRLNPNGVILFTCGGGHTIREVSGAFQGQDFDYSTLGVDTFLQIHGSSIIAPAAIWNMTSILKIMFI